MRKEFIIVDDDKIVLFIQEKMFKNLGICSNPIKFSNASEGLNYIESTYKEVDLFVVFLDINMPYLNGWEFLDAIKEMGHKIKVFMVSSSTDVGDIKRAKSNPLVLEYLIKPVSELDLEDLKEKHNFLKN